MYPRLTLLRQFLREDGAIFVSMDDGEVATVQVVKYKRADHWTDAQDDCLIGGLWSELSDARCRFVMVRDKRWEWIDAQLP